MKKMMFLMLIIISILLYSQDDNPPVQEDQIPEMNTESQDITNAPVMPGDEPESSTSYTGTAIIGGITIDGKNYQQIGLRLDIPIGKFGFGLDAQILIDEEGKIREEDWDEFEDYLDKIYYVRWARKGDPFYIRLGGLDYSYLGYNIIVDGYSNMIEYPAYKRLGMEMSFETENYGGELLINNYKELFTDKPGLLLGMRGFYKVWGDLAVGLTYATDMNEYNGLRDNDDDGYPNEIDRYPEDDRYATDWEYYADQMNPALADSMVTYGVIDKDSLDSYKDRTSSLSIWGLDIGYPLFENDFMKIDIYGQWAQINGYGSGFSAPGFRMKAGPFIFSAEYRHTDGKFLFGYFNPTYEMERAIYRADLGTFETKQDILDYVPALDGYFAGLHFDGWGFFRLQVNYQDLRAGSGEDIEA
ncbi:MAG: hypothetical protein L6407_04665, partial [Candidatus Delongbacteria bacterium]|nr:hypothetical protein [Candidatus Delongbacteria bacterium]